MAEQQRKFGALASLRQRSPAADTEPVSAPIRSPATDTEAVTASIANPAEEPARRKGRPAGKRSNPEWKLYSHFLKRRTQRDATAILQAEDNGRDLSDVLQQALEQWVAQRKA
jgi:hypothetical protein